jgi:phosphatidylserine/phosphatidylglycerophosphate/cardiolipin synthase-like enzyme
VPHPPATAATETIGSTGTDAPTPQQPAAHAAPPSPPATPSPWFVETGRHPVRTTNAVTAFVDGDAYFADVADAIRSADGPEAFVELVDWDLQVDFELVPGDPASTLAALLADASRRGVVIRALLNRHQSNPFGPGTVTGYDNSAAAAFIDSLPTGAALHDDRYLTAGTHHQKIAVVGSAGGLVAYSGGMDFNPNRLLRAPETRHDVQLRVAGPAAMDHHTVFANRWADHPASADLPALPVPRAVEHGTPGSLQAQVVTTYGNGSTHAGIGPGRGAVTPGYTFAPQGDRSVSDLVLRAIGRAQQFIYLEDQYLVNLTISAALLDALQRIDRLIVVMPDSPSVSRELIQAWRRRKAFITPLLVAAPSKVSICVGTRFYVHSKLWVFDDDFAIVGSANVNRRGYSHDSEQAVGIADVEGDGAWVKQLRTRLWAKHLRMPEELLHDPLAAAAHWFAIPAGADVSPYNPSAGSDSPPFPRGTDYFWDTYIDPAGE